MSFGQLPPPFIEDELIHIEGVSRPLLPPKSDARTQVRASASSPDSPSHWQAVWPTKLAPRETDPIAEPACPPDCTLHSQAAHDASIVLRKMNAFPARYMEQWQPDGTDDVLYWLQLQSPAVSTPPPPSQVDAAEMSTTDPNVEDAVLLRLCTFRPFQPREISIADKQARKSSTSSRGSKRPWTAIRTWHRTCTCDNTFPFVCAAASWSKQPYTPRLAF